MRIIPISDIYPQLAPLLFFSTKRKPRAQYWIWAECEECGAVQAKPLSHVKRGGASAPGILSTYLRCVLCGAKS